MPTYVTLARFTRQGAQTIDSFPDRVQNVKAAMAEAGGEWISFYLTHGQYDLVAVSRWADEYKAMAFHLWLARQGNVRTETLRAFGEDEIARIMGK